MQVLLFAGLKEKAGETSVTLEIEQAVSVSELKAYIYDRFPEFDGEVFQVARNESFVPDTAVVESSDTVALIPPVSGG